MKDQDDRPAAPTTPAAPEEHDHPQRADRQAVEGFREWAEAEREEARRLERYQRQSSTNTEVPRDPDKPAE